MTLKPHTVKLNIRVQEWPFYFLSNSLGIITGFDSQFNFFKKSFFIGITLDSNVQDQCVHKQVNENDSLQWSLVNIDGASLYQN